jgi:hypothetical protein
MKKEITIPNNRQYPYLAYFSLDERIPINESIADDGIYIISKPVGMASDEVLIQHLYGNVKEYISKKETDYTPLPSGTKLTLIQE